MIQKICYSFMYLSLLFSSTEFLKAEFSLPFSGTNSPGQNTDSVQPDKVVLFTPYNAEAFSDGHVIVTLGLSTKDSFSIYHEKVKFLNSKNAAFIKFIPPKGTEITDPLTDKNTTVYHEGFFKILFQNYSPYKENEFELTITFTGCTKNICLFPFTMKFPIQNAYHNFPITQEDHILFYGKKANLSDEKIPTDIPPEETITNTQKSEQHASNKLAAETPAQDNSAPDTITNQESLTQDSLAQNFSAKSIAKASLFWLLLIALLGGLLTNLTPCVYPMIPITIRVLGNQSHSPYLASSLYGLGIVISYTGLGLVSILTGSLFGNIMTSPLFNVVVAFIMFILGTSMLGFVHFSRLQQIGSQIKLDHKGTLNALVMGLGAGLIASPCTGPILGALLTYGSLQKDRQTTILLLFTYSVGFAFPYVLLGKSAAMLQKKKIPPFWQILVKYVFASLMFALSFYYLRLTFYNLYKDLKPHFLNLGLISLLSSSSIYFLRYSLKIFRSKFFDFICALLLGFSLFSFSQLSKISQSSQTEDPLKINWATNESEAFEKAKEKNLPILIDMWAEWCEACKKMDNSTFVDPSVIKALKKNWITLKYDLTESTPINDKIQSKYKIQGLPSLVITTSDETKQRILSGYVSSEALLSALEEFKRRD